MRKTLDKIILSGFVLMCLNYGNVREAYCARPPEYNLRLTWKANDPNQPCECEPDKLCDLYCNKSNGGIIGYKIFCMDSSKSWGDYDFSSAQFNDPTTVYSEEACQDGECSHILTGLDPSKSYKIAITAFKIGFEGQMSNTISIAQGGKVIEENCDEDNWHIPNSNQMQDFQSGCFLLTIKKTTEKNEKNIR
ncbi:MAG: fibronectin type III domain-containing protein [Nanoarchaeota archaeon]